MNTCLHPRLCIFTTNGFSVDLYVQDHSVYIMEKLSRVIITIWLPSLEEVHLMNIYLYSLDSFKKKKKLL